MVHGGLRPARAEPSRMTESSLFGILMVVTLMVVTLMVVTLRVSTLMVSTLVVAQSFGGVEIVEVNLRAGCVEDAGLLQDCRKRLATSDLGHHVGDLTALVDCLGKLIGVHAVLLGGHHQVLDQFRLANADLFLLGNRVEQELGTHRVTGVLVDLSAVLVILEAALILEVPGHLSLDERVGDGNLGVLQQVLKDLVASLNALLHLLGTLGLDLDVGPELLKAVELRGKLGELVVELWKDTLLDRLNGHVDLGVLALVLATRERGVEDLALLGGHPDKSVVQAIDHVAGADLVGDALGRVDLFLANRSREVDGHEVTHGSHSLNTGQSTETLTQGNHSRLNISIGRLGVNHVDLDRDAVVVRQSQLGTDVDLDGELQLLALLGRHLGHVNLGLTERTYLVVLHGLAIEARKGLVDGLLQHRAASHTLVDDPGRNLAGAETGNVDLRTDRLVCRIEARLELVEGDLDSQLDPGRVEGLDGTLHYGALQDRGGRIGIARTRQPSRDPGPC